MDSFVISAVITSERVQGVDWRKIAYGFSGRDCVSME
jgi:hypothetical protein